MRKKVQIGLLLLAAAVLIAGSVLIGGLRQFNIEENFTPIPLAFDPADSTSTYQWNGSEVQIQGGFVKGKIIGKDKVENLVLRSLTPSPIVKVRGNPDSDQALRIQLENINPVNSTVNGAKISQDKVVDPHTIRLDLNLARGEEQTVAIAPDLNKDYPEFIILGDNRDGYQTFATIIEQINAINPIFVIDNGDLVFGGEPNKYRLFYETVSKLRVPLYTTLGNHDIRQNGRDTYTMLFGPPYYAFDYGREHFVFLDSSRGWAEKTAIPEEQYAWLEADLKTASERGQKIFVISHIPPVDPRSNLEKNTFPNEPGVAKTTLFETLMNKYSNYANMDHGFPDKQEAARFENLMTKYGVDTVFNSHIHSYYSFLKGGVQYIISGGAGAELLTTDSYYHYLQVKVTEHENYIKMIQLPSPTNTLQNRYLAAIQLFANAILKEYRTTVVTVAVILALSIGWLLYSTQRSWFKFLKFLAGWLLDVLKYAWKRLKEWQSHADKT